SGGRAARARCAGPMPAKGASPPGGQPTRTSSMEVAWARTPCMFQSGQSDCAAHCSAVREAATASRLDQVASRLARASVGLLIAANPTSCERGEHIGLAPIECVIAHTASVTPVVERTAAEAHHRFMALSLL